MLYSVAINDELYAHPIDGHTKGFRPQHAPVAAPHGAQPGSGCRLDETGPGACQQHRTRPGKRDADDGGRGRQNVTLPMVRSLRSAGSPRVRLHLDDSSTADQTIATSVVPARRWWAVRCGAHWQRKTPPGEPDGALRKGASVAAALARPAGPDRAVGVAVLVLDQVGVDRSGEARVVELERVILLILLR